MHVTSDLILKLVAQGNIIIVTDFFKVKLLNKEVILMKPVLFTSEMLVCISAFWMSNVQHEKKTLHDELISEETFTIPLFSVYQSGTNWSNLKALSVVCWSVRVPHQLRHIHLHYPAH